MKRLSNKIFIIFLLISSSVFCQSLHIGTGISSTFASMEAVGKNYGQLEESHSRKIAPDINLLFETRRFGIISFKTGLFFHPEYYRYNHYISKSVGSDGNIWGGNWWLIYYADPVDELIFNIDFPMMLSANFSNKTINYCFDLGLYLGRTLYNGDGNSPNIEFSKNDAGIVFAGGLGSKKWQFRLYSHVGLKNILKDPGIYQDAKVARAFTLGLNLTRVIQFKNGKKSLSE
jgi:hypothetical protein